MTRIIRTESPARIREKMMRSLASAYRIYIDEKTTKSQQEDICAFALLTLKALGSSIDQTALAWEKRDYWLKADQLRREWEWTSSSYKELRSALLANDIATALSIFTGLSEHFESVKMPRKKSSRFLWRGAWEKWKKIR